MLNCWINKTKTEDIPLLLTDSEVYRNCVSEMLHRIITFIIVGGFTLSGIMKLSPVISPEIHSQMVKFRSSHRWCSAKKGDLKNFAIFTGKHLCRSFFFNKVAGLRPASLLKKRLRHRCFPVNFGKFLRTPFLQNTSGWLLLKILTSFILSCSCC